MLVVTALWGYWQPAQARLERNQAQVVALNRAISATNARLALTDQYIELSAQVDELERQLQANVDRSKLVERMTALASQAKTRIIHGTNDFGKPRAGVVPVIQDLTVEGAYPDVRDFVERVAALETLSLLLSVDFSANPDGTLVRGKMRFMTLVERGT
jgi:Tfp pilus assembly protein PilO